MGVGFGGDPRLREGLAEGVGRCDGVGRWEGVGRTEMVNERLTGGLGEKEGKLPRF